MKARPWLSLVLTSSFTIAVAASLTLTPTGCATAPAKPETPAFTAFAEAPTLVHGGALGDEGTAVDAIYEEALTLPEARKRVEAVLGKHPQAARAHEAAAYLAELADDHHAAWYHFWRAAQDLDNPLVAVDLQEIEGGLTRSETEASLALYRLLRLSHPSPTVRDVATIYEARALNGLGRRSEVPALVKARGLLTKWLVLGPFDNESGKGFRAPFPPESGVDVTKPVDGLRVKVSWRRLPPASQLGGVLFAKTLWPSSPAVGYVVTWVRAPEARDVFLRLSTESPTRAWLNDALVISEEQLKGGGDDNLSAPVHLARGWNQLLVKSAQGDETWWLRARFTDRAGVPVGDLEESDAPQTFAPATPLASSSAPPELVTVPPFLEASPALPEGSRRSFLLARWLSGAGHLRRAVAASQPWVEAHPDNLLALQTTATLSWMNSEAGKAIDLLNRAVERAGQDAPSFYGLRGAYYLQRQLYDKAQADYLAEVAAQPASRRARLALAELFSRRGWTVDECLALEDAARRWPDDADATERLGRCQIERGDVTKGLATLERAHVLAPGDEGPVAVLYHHALSERRFADAHRFLAKLQEIDPASPVELGRAADLARREGRPVGEQEAIYREVNALCPTCSGGFEELGDLAWEQGRKEDALAAWRQARERDPNDSTLAQRIEFHAPTKLGFIEKLVPREDDIARALLRPFKPEPGAQFVRLLDHEVTEVNADGSAKRVVTLVSQALNEHGRDSLIEMRTPTYGDVKILQAYSLSKEGERQEASSVRRGVVRFRALEVGSKVVVQYVHYQAAGHFLENQFVSGWYFRSPQGQSEDARWTLVMPKDRPLKVHIDGEVKLAEEVDGPWRIRTFTSPPSPPLLPEAHAPPPDDVLWSVHVSTVPDWEEYVRWERALLTDAFQETSRLKGLAARLTEGLTAPQAKLDRLYQFVSKEIRYQQDYEDTVAGVRPHAGPVVLERGYGDCKDKAVLLIQLGKLSGLRLEFALLRTTAAGRVRADVPNQQFNHAIVYVPVQPGIAEATFLDPTSDGLDLGSLPSTDQGATTLVLDPDTGHWQLAEIPYQNAGLNYTHVALDVNVRAPGDVSVGETFVSRGHQASGLRHMARNPSVAERMLQGYVSQKLPGTRLLRAEWPESEDITKPVVLKMQIEGARALQEDGDRLTFHLPTTFRLADLVTLEQRQTPLQLGIAQEMKHTLSFTYPTDHTLAHRPSDVTIKHPCFDMQRRVSARGQLVTVTDEYRIVCHELAPADYPAFRDKVRDALARLRDDITLAKGRGARPRQASNTPAQKP